MKIRFAVLVLILIALTAISLVVGSVAIPIGDVIPSLISATRSDSLGPSSVPRDAQVASAILTTVRLPRTVMAIGAGAALSVAGLLMQTVFRNALAGPGVLGVTSGAGLGVAIILLAGGSMQSIVPVSVAAIVGASAVLVMALAVNRIVGQPVLLLVLGLLFGYAASAGTTLLMSATPAEGLERYVVWSFGSFAVPPGGSPIALVASITAIVFVLTRRGPFLDLLLLGPSYAESSGINARRTHGFLILLSGALTGVVTALAGPITFIGVAVPHLARGWVKSSRHRVLVPATALSGASLGLAADIISRGPGIDKVFPLNAVMALIGVPVVLSVLLHRSGRSEAEDLGV